MDIVADSLKKTLLQKLNKEKDLKAPGKNLEVLNNLLKSFEADTKSFRGPESFTTVQICLGHIGMASELYFLRNIPDEEKEFKLAIVALFLGLIEEGETLLLKAGRYKDLVSYYKYQNQWEKAFELCKKHDLIGLKTLYYEYGKYLEVSGDYDQAIEAFEKSETHETEVPRMLTNQPIKLKQYIDLKQTKSLLSWYGRFCESQKQNDEALVYYEKAGDFLSAVRLYCKLNALEKAVEYANLHPDLASFFHLGRLFEQQKNAKEAVYWYEKANCYSQAIRIATEAELVGELMQLSLSSPNKDLLLESAQFMEKKNLLDKAISLYFKAGALERAVDLAFQTNHWILLEMISSELNDKTPASVLEKCALYFLEKGEFKKAMSLYFKQKKIQQALNLCLEKKIILTEEMIEEMNLTDPEQLKVVADCCFKQGSYHLASKKYTQAGDRMKAIEALLRTGDMEKIIFFANVSGAKQKEIYIMTANYFQTLNWHENFEILKAILTFYNKAKAWEHLCLFYENMANYEIDEFSNYEKALEALKQAFQSMEKSEHEIRDQKLQQLQRKMDLIQHFIEYKTLEGEEKGQLLSQMLQEPEIQNVVRIGDLLGELIRFFHEQKDEVKLKYFWQLMKQNVPKEEISFYLSPELLNELE